MISIGRKLFEEVDIPTESKIITEDAITKTLQRESSWTAEINGINPYMYYNLCITIYVNLELKKLAKESTENANIICE